MFLNTQKSLIYKYRSLHHSSHAKIVYNWGLSFKNSSYPVYCIVEHHRQVHVAAARKRSHQWCLTLTPNNTKTTEKMRSPCFLWPIRRHLPSGYYTPKLFQSSKRKGPLQHSVDKEVSALARLTFYENLLIGQEKVSVVTIKLCP